MTPARRITESTLVRISISVFLIMGSGLVAGTTYLVNLSNASTDQARQIQELRSSQGEIATLHTDLEVIKAELKLIERKLDDVN